LVTLLIGLDLLLKLIYVFIKTLFLHIILGALIFEFHFYRHDFFLFQGQLSSNFLNFVFKLVLSLNYLFFSPLKFHSTLSNFGLGSGYFSDSFIESLLSLNFFLLPFTSDLLNTLNFLLFKVNQKLSHLCTFPHF